MHQAPKSKRPRLRMPDWHMTVSASDLLRLLVNAAGFGMVTGILLAFVYVHYIWRR